ncbi:hypothetical protein GW951_01735 [Candidatus Wolfebacteria bacterium]|nr:hypothetical protein [Candidatus Wolfebacteria bacterium]
MSSFNFPIFKTKNVSVSKGFNLADPVERREYFDLKAGEEIKKIRDFLKDKTFVAYLLGKKNSGKGTYTKLFMEAVGSENISHVSVGDIIRAANQDLLDSDKKDAITDFLKANYRGFMPLEKAIEAILSRDTKTLIPTEITLALIKWEISRLNKKAVFLDGFPRDLDQISYALYFRDLINYRNDPDFFVFIDLPEAIINERMKTRVVCPICHTPRTTKLLITKEVGYDKEKKEFYLICDNPECNKARMVAKEGDALGIEAIRGRIQTDDKIMRMLLELNGVPKVFLRNSVPVKLAEDSVDDYEITPAYSFKLNEELQKVEIIESPWTVNDDDGELSYSLLAPAVAVSMIKQVAKVLGL